MNVKLIRDLDFWICFPWCFLLSILDTVLKIFKIFRKKEVKPPAKILVIKLSEMGAIVLSYPLLRRIKREFPSVELFFLTFERNREIFPFLEGIIPDKNIFTIDEKNVSGFISDTVRVTKALRRERIDVTLDLEFFSRFTAILSYLTNAGKRVGFYHYTFEGLHRGTLFTHNVQYNPLAHVSKTYLSLWQIIRKDKKDSPELEEKVDNEDIILPKFVSSPDRARSIRDKLKARGLSENNRLFILNPGEGILPLREWPLENFIALSGKILEGAENYVVVVGTRDASKKAAAICQSLQNKRCIDLTAGTTLPEILELFNMSDALVSNDCGLAHLASLTAIKKFIIFGPETPLVFAPLGQNNWIIYSDWPCSPCLSALNHRNSACKDNRCLRVISPDDVYELIKKSV